MLSKTLLTLLYLSVKMIYSLFKHMRLLLEWEMVISIYRANEFILAALAIFWGLILLLPSDLFGSIERYRYFNEFAPDTVWGAIFILSAFCTILGKPHWLHVHAHWILCTLWSGIAFLSGIAMRSPLSLLIPSLCLAIAAIHATKFWRLNRVVITSR